MTYKTFTSDAVAGVLFVFVPFRAQEAGHLQSLMYGWMPIGLWALHRYFATGRRTALAGFAAAFLLAGLSNGHFFYFFAAVVVIVAGLELIFHVRSRPRMLIELPVAAAVMVAAVLPVMSGYLAARDLYGMQRSRQEVISYAANSVAWLDPGFCLAALAVCGLLAACLRRGPDRDATRSDCRIAVMYTLVAVVGVAFALGPEPTVNGVRLMASGPYDWQRGIVPAYTIPLNAVLSRHETLVDSRVLCGDAGMHCGMAHSRSAAGGTDGPPPRGVAGERLPGRSVH